MNIGRFILATSLIVILGLLQNTDLLMIAGVKPNLLLAALIAIAFFVEDVWLFSFFILLSDILLKVRGFLVPEILVFTLLAMTAAWAAARWHTQPILNNAFLIAIFTVLFYVLTSPSYLVAHFGLLVIELIYNLVIGVIVFNLFNQCLKTSSMLKT